jgi:hypothetical protein
MHPLYAGIATVANSAAQPPPHGLDRDEQQCGADYGNTDRAKHIPQESGDEFGDVSHSVTNPQPPGNAPMTMPLFPLH